MQFRVGLHVPREDMVQKMLVQVPVLNCRQEMEGADVESNHIDTVGTEEQ